MGVYNGYRLPDFIIAGAMKCGTTSLHRTLNFHPDIYIPEREIGFFDIDEFEQHKDFFFHDGKKWYIQDFEAKFDEYLGWYAKFFQEAGMGQLIGEDSTTYIASEDTPGRISKLLPNAKILILLRDPARRTYSHYLHLLLSGRAVYSFEDSLQFTTNTLIQRSLYKKQIENFYEHLPKENIRVLIFDEFVSKMHEKIEQVLDFLGLSNTIDLDKIQTHANRTSAPRSLQLMIWRNRILRKKALARYLRHLPNMPTFSKKSFWDRAVNSLDYRLNPRGVRKVPEMRQETHKFLNTYFKRKNRGLSELIGQDVEKYWYKNKSG